MKLIKELYKYREFLRTSIKKEIRGKYKKSFLGVLWSFLNPLLMLAVYAIIFPIILKNDIPNYVLFLFTAMIPWTFFTTTLTQGTNTMLMNGNIIKKVYFPREILPISIVTSGLINFLISCIIMFVFLIFGGLGLTKYALLMPIIIIIQYIFQLGLILLLSSITVYLRDLEHIIGIVIQVMFYGTPIVYSIRTMDNVLVNILKLNPMTHIIEGYRSILYYQELPDFFGLGIVAIISVILVMIGFKVFDKLQKRFAEEL